MPLFMLLPWFRFSFHLSRCLSRYLLHTLHSGYFSRDLAVLAQINLWLCSFIRELTAIVLNLPSVSVFVSALITLNVLLMWIHGFKALKEVPSYLMFWSPLHFTNYSKERWSENKASLHYLLEAPDRDLK